MPSRHHHSQLKGPTSLLVHPASLLAGSAISPGGPQLFRGRKRLSSRSPGHATATATPCGPATTARQAVAAPQATRHPPNQPKTSRWPPRQQGTHLMGHQLVSHLGTLDTRYISQTSVQRRVEAICSGCHDQATSKPVQGTATIGRDSTPVPVQ